jgi:hypothetical protein
MSPNEIISLCLPLRRSVFHEFGWTKQSRVDNDGRDRYDESAIHYGYFLSDLLVGAIRLVIAPTLQGLPSGSYLQGQTFVGNLGELCKGIVAPQFRGGLVLTSLLHFGISEAQTLGISHLFLSAFDTDRIRRFYTQFGFATLGASFIYEDKNIRPSERAIVFHKELK